MKDRNNFNTTPIMEQKPKVETKPNVGPGQKKENDRKKGLIWIILAIVLFLSNGVFVGLWLSERNRANTEVIIKEEITTERDNVKADLLELQEEYATLQTNDKAMQVELEAKRAEIAQLLEEAEKHKNDASIISKLRKEVATLRKIMKHYVHEIDSLNTLNQTIIAEKNKVSADLNAEKGVTSKLSKDNDALKSTVNLGSILKASSPVALGVKVKSGGKKEVESSRASRIDKIKVSFVLGENKIAKAGSKTVYVRIVSPDGKEICKSEDSGNMFSFNGSKGYFAGREEVDYRNEDLPVVVYCESPNEFVSGKYQITIGCDNVVIGETTLTLK